MNLKIDLNNDLINILIKTISSPLNWIGFFVIIAIQFVGLELILIDDFLFLNSINNVVILIGISLYWFGVIFICVFLIFGKLCTISKDAYNLMNLFIVLCLVISAISLFIGILPVYLINKIYNLNQYRFIIAFFLSHLFLSLLIFRNFLRSLLVRFLVNRL